jgi:hypothetical protein
MSETLGKVLNQAVDVTAEYGKREGGGITVSRFLEAGALHRLQITVAPVILGSGRPAIVLPEISDLGSSLRPRTRRVVMGDDMMIECDFEAMADAQDAARAGARPDADA